ncbi:PQ loop repeat-domain-containing protein [Linnemannia elongata]|nr:PQ loop repeat-domain-containing protein [Linnemannia elongata]
MLSNIAGSLSILCWFIVFTPQIWMNYKRKSGESLSLPFLYIWLAGDFLNVAGATMDNLLLTMRILAWYYTIADILLIAQVYYYRRTSVRSSFESACSTRTTASERFRFLQKRRSVRQWILIILPILATAFFVWSYIEWRNCVLGEIGDGDGTPGPDNGNADECGWLALFFGWGSAALYLGSRIPQLYKNWRLKSCEGLSIMMFLFSVFGNALFVASIFLNSTERGYLIRNMPWWLGSTGTLVFDFSVCILCPFDIIVANDVL